MKDYFLQRKKQLKECELDYFNKSVDRKNHSLQRTVYRKFSKEFQARRSELEDLETYLKDKMTEDASMISGLDINGVVEQFYDLNLQNLNPRFTENEAFKEGIEVGIRDLLESIKTQLLSYVQLE